MENIVDAIGNTTVTAKEDGSYVLTTGGKSITLPPGTFSAQRELTAEFRDEHYYIAYYHELGVTFTILSPTSVNGRYPMEQNLKYWEPVLHTFRAGNGNPNISWNAKDPTTWGRNEWQYTEIDSTLDWFFKPSYSNGSSSTNTGSQTASALSTTDAVDTLIGTSAKDVFSFSSIPAYGQDSADHITGFSTKQKDLIQISSSAFGLSKKGTIKIAANQKSFDKLQKSTTPFIYNKLDGGLYFNANGKADGFGEGGLFGVIDNAASMNIAASSFKVLA
jgi:hypothetical protein